ncbi:MAG: hypothetical protein A3G59_03660 [Candidatus Taylorbacteria bacterium RIFCSPLOWO2_12_FULL_47_20]|uniref:AI-2E family transporter n=2 Tax=Candidatus Tayloriibacteriota TaxID=1817919 RepID=A0A1G2P572_9BACT|nr:MAG: hypothetical protein A3H68_00085 [Candidatus Taylorbacteria bacterium RIFCSPLOWO2_02_FULL_46_40]OHA43484.1 MAG: hypothetical protein A3G59_03660 [Candidatus Taylorbacteria bacterium RIFCSPLOWO2_12_FULL_47_20]
MPEIGNSKVIQITTGTIVRAILVVAAFVLLYTIRDILLVVLTSVVIAAAIEPAIQSLIRLRIKRIPAVILTYATIVLVLLGIFYVFLPPLVTDTSSFLSTVSQYIDKVSFWNPLNSDVAGQNPQNFVENVAKGIDVSKEVTKEITDGGSALLQIGGQGGAAPGGLDGQLSKFQQSVSNISDSFIKLMSIIFGGVLSFILIAVLSFYLAVQENGVESFLRIVTPVKYEAYVVGLWRRSQQKIGYWMQGQLLLALLVGVLVYLGLMILGVKNALLFAIIAAVLEVIPVFGPIIASIPPIVAGFSQSGLTGGILVAGLFLIIQQFENHLLYPLVVRKIVGVPPIIVIIALIIGVKVAGFIGIILSVPMAAILMEFLNDYEREKIGRASRTNVIPN